jgi:hypothetical protein
MNEQQKKVIVILAVVIVLMLFFPPFHFITYNGIERNMGFSFLLSPPKDGYSVTGSINISQLLIQWIGVSIVGGLFYFLMKGEK